MVATVTNQTIHNGNRRLTIKTTIGGTTGDTTAGTLVDVSAVDANIGVNGLRLDKVTYDLIGTSVSILWDGTANVEAVNLDGEGVHDFTHVGGIKNNAGAGATGDVLFTTTGYTAAGDGGHMLLEFAKVNRSR